MARIDRRRLLKLSGASAVAAGTGGITAILASGRAPAYGQATSIHWLRWADFVPASDKVLKDQIAPQCQKALGIKLNIEMINANDLQARTTAAIQSGAGPDVIMLLGTWPQLYTDSLVDVSDVAEEIGRAQGGYYDTQRILATVGNKWIGVPWAVGGGLVTYRKSWLAEARAEKFPETWDEFRAVGKKLKAAGHPYGQTAGHTFGDAPGWWYPYLWSWGGKEVEKDGKTVVLNTKETLESVKFMNALWKDAHDEGALAWDDTNNNRAFLSQTISATLNGASIYIETLRKPEQYKTEDGKPLNTDILHAPLPKGPAGQFGFHLLQSNMIMKYSKNQDAAKQFLKWMHDEANYRRFFESQKGFATPCTAKWEGDKLWDVDPVMTPYKVAAKLGQAIGYAGPPNAKAQEGLSKYVITDMYAKAVQGMPAEESVKWAEAELKKIYQP